MGGILGGILGGFWGSEQGSLYRRGSCPVLRSSIRHRASNRERVTPAEPVSSWVIVIDIASAYARQGEHRVEG